MASPLDWLRQANTTGATQEPCMTSRQGKKAVEGLAPRDEGQLIKQLLQ
jgi:hypothetical protein